MPRRGQLYIVPWGHAGLRGGRAGARVLESCVGIRLLLAEMRKGVAQWSAGDLHQPLERPVHLQDQEDRT